MRRWIDLALEWCEAHIELLSWLGVLSLVLLIATALLVPVFVGKLPVDEFRERRAPRHHWRDLHPALAILMRILRNTVGAICVLAGIAMLVLPGQGLLTIFVGVLLLEIPGKRRLVLCVVSKRPVQRALNWIRRHRKVPEFSFAPAPCQAPSRKDRRARAETKSATMTISPDSATKKKTSS
jgi:putative transmembrane protein PGPGW